MERVVFLVEATGERIGCMLNPENFVVRRQAGVQAQRSLGHAVSNESLRDDPLLWSGGGRTEIELQLLFDVGLLHESQRKDDVRDLTRPLHDLSESRTSTGKMPPVARFIWGKAWNIRCVVTAVAERFEHFNSAGVPRRSWLSMRLIRMDETGSRKAVASAPALPIKLREASSVGAFSQLPVHEMLGQGGGAASTGGRLDIIAHAQYGNAGYWRVIAEFNDIADPTRVAAGSRLQLPAKSVLGDSP